MLSAAHIRFDEGQLLRGLKNGSESAWKQIVDQHKVVLFYKAYDILNDTEEAKDVVQELFMSLWIKRANLKVSGSLENYLYVAVRNRSLNKLESRKVYNQHTAQFGYLNSDTSTSLTPNEEEDNFKQLASAMQKISCDPAFPAFKLHHFEHKSYQQIADELGMAYGSVKNQVSRAVQKIRNMLK